MSDDGSKRGGYKFDYAPTARAQCKGPKPCKGNKIDKGVLRLGVVNEVQGHVSWAYRHYGCMTKKVFQNIKKAYPSVEDVEGFNELTDADKDKIRTAWEIEAVASEDIPATAVAGADDDEAGPKKKPGRPRKKQKTDDGEEGDEAPKPKKKAAPRRKKKADSEDDADVSLSEDEGGSDYGAGKKRKRGGGKKSPKKKAGHDDDD